MIQNKIARRAAVIGVAILGYPLLVGVALLFAVVNATAAAASSVFDDVKDTHFYLAKEIPSVLRSGWSD